jgi:ATP-binding cassette, subfamily C (CFTR/MRP), member 10
VILVSDGDGDMQVRYAFLAGLAVVLLLFPVNRWIALRIQSASIEMMACKDNRIRVLGELLRGMQQIKISAWEACFVERVSAISLTPIAGIEQHA